MGWKATQIHISTTTKYTLTPPPPPAVPAVAPQTVRLERKPKVWRIDMATEGGSEWEPIKILFEGGDFSNKMNSVGYPKSHVPHATFRLPKPRSHWSATGPRNKHCRHSFYTRSSGYNLEAIFLGGSVRPGMGAIRPPTPGNQEILWKASSELQNSSRFQPQDPLVKAKLVTIESRWKQELHPKGLGRLDRLTGAV
jgi:hypothetical protein